MNKQSLYYTSDHRTLSCQTRRVAMAVLVTGLIMGSVYMAALAYFGVPTGPITVSPKPSAISL